MTAAARRADDRHRSTARRADDCRNALWAEAPPPSKVDFKFRAPRRLRSDILSDFISSPHYPFKKLHQVAEPLLLRHIVAGQLSYTAPCRHLQPVAPGAHLAHGTDCHGAAYTAWLAITVDGSDGGDIHASHGRTSFVHRCHGVVRTSCWSTGLAGRFFVAAAVPLRFFCRSGRADPPQRVSGWSYS